jgi:hypothetical protein
METKIKEFENYVSSIIDEYSFPHADGSISSFRSKLEYYEYTVKDLGKKINEKGKELLQLFNNDPSIRAILEDIAQNAYKELKQKWND